MVALLVASILMVMAGVVVAITASYGFPGVVLMGVGFMVAMWCWEWLDWTRGGGR